VKRTALALALAAWTAWGADGVYELRPGSPDGIGKFYMGREIAQVMGHPGAGWLERPGRVEEERTDLLIRELRLQATDVVADLGAGTGFFSLPLARVVAQGKVLAVDIQPEMLEIIRGRIKKENVPNIEPILASETDPHLPPNSVDLVLLVDAYHEFSYPLEVMQHVAAALRPGGRVALVEYRGEDPDVPIKEVHKMTEQQARREMAAAGLRWIRTDNLLPQQHLMLFGGADSSPGAPMLLATQYGELCTMCEGYLRCSLDGDAGVTVYHVRIKDFWQQVATIGDWFMYVFRSPRDERRRLDVYQRLTDRQGRAVRVVLPDQEARLSLAAGRIEVPGGWIDRRSNAWHRDDSSRAGRCQLMPLAEGRKIAASFVNGPP
jgi:SAM-dependent methyltransferase